MKLKKLLSLVITMAMLLSCVGITAFAENASGVNGVAEVNGVQYASLQEAIDAANAGDTITLLGDIILEDTVEIPAGKIITLDLAGKTISQTKAQTAAYQMILNDGSLTIEDSVGEGKISYTDSGNGGDYISDTIYNRGTLVINGGTIENLSSATVAYNGYPHAVDTYSGIRNTSVTINGGTIYCAEYSAIRMFCVSATNTADLTINGGTIKGAVDMQNGTANAANGSLTITDGTFEKNASRANVRFANWNGGATGFGITASVTGGTFDTGLDKKSVPAAANWDSKIVTGGTFAVKPDDSFAAEGYKFEQNNDGSYGVEECSYVAEVSGVKYSTLEEAVAAANAATDSISVIKMLADTTLNASVVSGKVVLDLNGYTITGIGSYAFYLADGADFTIMDSSEKQDGLLSVASSFPENAIYMMGANSTFTLNSGNIYSNNNGVLVWSATAQVNLNGGSIVSNKETSESRVLYMGAGNVSITGGMYSGYYFAGVWGGNLSITGGNFSEDVVGYCADGYTTVKNADNTYTITEVIPEVVAKIGETEYYTLKDAIVAAKANDTISIVKADSYKLEGASLGENNSYYLPAGLTIKGEVDGVVVANGPSITANSITIDNVDFINGSGSALVFHFTGNTVIKNSRIEAPTGTYYSTVYGELTIDNCEIISTSTYGLGIFESSANLNIKDSTLSGYQMLYTSGEVTIDSCEFKDLYYYNCIVAEGNTTITNSTFDPNAEIATYAAYTKEHVITINGCSVTDNAKQVAEIVEPDTVEGCTVYVDGVLLGAKELIKLVATTVTLGNSLAIDFIYAKSDFEGTDYYAKIEHTTPTGVVVTEIGYDKWVSNGNYFDIPYSGIAAKQMADNVNITIYKGDNTVVSETESESLVSYAKGYYNYYKNDSKQSLWLTAMADMLNYGAAAQNFFDYNTENLANSIMPSEFRECASEKASPTGKYESFGNVAGTALTLSDRILLSAVFTGIKPGMTAKIEFTDHYGTKHSYDGTFKQNANPKYHEVVVDRLVIADADQTVTVTVYNEDGSVYAWVKDSVNESLEYAMKLYPDEPLYEMTAKFAASAYKAFHSK